MREKWFLFMLMIVTVPIAGELNFYPFHNDFRVSLGTPAFFLFLLWIRSVSPFVSGLLVGTSVVIFRVVLDAAIGTHWNWTLAFQHHYPVFFYYLTYSITFAAVRMNRHHDRPLLLGVLGLLVEIAATSVELLLRNSASDQITTMSTWNQIVLIAFFRSFFVIGFFNLVKLRQTKAAEEQQRKEKEKMLLLFSGLYEESIQLKKTLYNAENITQESYELYQSLKESSFAQLEDSAQKALRIAGQVHEIKKDNQRIYAGLSSLITHESDYLPMQELAGIVLHSNQKYAQSLGKQIDFTLQIEGEFPLCHVYATLSLFNNLVANAVEALKESGNIRICVKREKDAVMFSVADDGPGVAPKHREKIFMPGFTTKYDLSGNPSTGIGLAYVKQEAEQMQGTIKVGPGIGGKGAEFTIVLPLGQIGKEV
ncbi:sensor histidine kinase [Paenibacillus sp. GCM10027628]|uniref:sensor histidine kinase n=1 Tax=Paenibacillus sp. GCM10027628 TaxID=3273413 RepID=UPI0036423A14